MVKISAIKAIEILDSRGNPTVMTTVKLSDGTVGTAKVPSGASTGLREAVELRDGGKRFGGKGVQQAVNNVNTVLAQGMLSVNPLSQPDVDSKLLEIDPSPGKGKLGANAILGVSMATAVAAGNHLGIGLYEYLRTKVIGKDAKYLQPVPMSNPLHSWSPSFNIHAANSRSRFCQPGRV